MAPNYFHAMNIFEKRQGQMFDEFLYFYTETINDFKPLLVDDHFKLEIINSWKYLVDSKLASIYAYVIMPNHIHLIWRMLGKNGKESVGSSFAKYTAHRFKSYLKVHDPELLQQYRSNKRDRSYQFWKRDPLAIPISTPAIFEQKLDYIHNNPVKDKWRLAVLPEDYRWSSAGYYKTGIDEFNILTDIHRVVSVGGDTDR